MPTISKEKTGADSEEDYSSKTSVASKPEEYDNKQPRAEGKGSDTTSTTNDPSYTSAATASVVKVVARHPASQSGLPTLPAAAAAAAPPVSRGEKKPRRAGFREQFLQQLRVMLDRESQNDSTIAYWSTDGNSFIITDQTKFEADIIPTYFDNPIVFASFLTKLHRWGFNRVSSSRQSGRYEFCSPTFRKLGPDSAPAAAAAADTPRNGGGGDSIQVISQQQAQESPLLQIMAQTNQPQANTVAPLISNIQHSSQQPSISSQYSVLNQINNQQNCDVANSILQSILGSNQQPLLSQQYPTPSQPPLTNQSASRLNNVGASNNCLQYPNPTSMNLLNNVVGGQTSSAQLMGNYPLPPPQSNALHALMNSLSGQQPTYPNTNTSPVMSELNNMTVQSLLALIHRVGEDERQRRAQEDALKNAIIATLGQILAGSSNMIDDAERQRGLLAAALGQTLGSTDERITVPLLRNPTGMTVRVPHNIAIQPQHVGMPPSAAGNLNIQAAGPIAAILQAAQRGTGAGQLKEDAHQTQIRRDDVDNNVKDQGKDDQEERALPPRKRKARDDDDSKRRKKK